MFDKLDDILMRLEEVLNQLSEPDVAADAAKFQKLMKEQAELQPIADAYKDYKTQKQTIEESLMLLEEESDEEMREMLKEELSDAKKRVEELEQELKVLLGLGGVCLLMVAADIKITHAALVGMLDLIHGKVGVFF